MKRALPKYVTEFPDRHGKYRTRFRRKGQATYYFRHPAGSDAFWKEYASCLAGEAAPPVDFAADRVKHGTINDLVTRYYRTPAWLAMKDTSRTTYRSIVERFRAKHGDKTVANIRVEHLDAILGKMSDTPAAANNLRKVLKRLFAYAVKIGLRADNPALPTDAYRTNSTGFHTWTEDEIGQFYARHAIGTKARLAMELMLWTGLRGRSDATRFGPQHLQNGRIRIGQTKTGNPVFVKVAPQLQRAIDACPSGQLTFLVTEFGKPFSRGGFGNWFRKRCNEAGLPQCAAHGLRKAISRRMAEIGGTHSEGKAVTGHKSDREFSRYSAEADQTRLADGMIDKLSRAEMANLGSGLAISNSNPLKRGA